MGKIDFDDENNEIIVHVRNPRLYVKCLNCGKIAIKNPFLKKGNENQ